MKPLQVYVSEYIHKTLKQKALDEGRTVADIVREMLGDDVELVESKPITYTKPESSA